jgi:putative hydrolase of the HAD superfamily
MNWIKTCVTFPMDHLPILKSISEMFPLALVSNFDHAPTGYQILEEYNLLPYFRTILFSDEVGWCKPHPILFTTALERLGVTPEEALFVGDTPDLDILGPKNIGMEVAWIENADHPLPPDYPKPDYYLKKFIDLPILLTSGNYP